MPLPPAIAAARTRLEQLLAEADRLERGSRDEGWRGLGDGGDPADFFVIADKAALTAWRASSEQVIRRLAGDTSHYLKRFHAEEGNSVHNVRSSRGVMHGLLNDLDAGQLADLPMLIRAEVFADFLEQAEYLLGEGFHVAAAVLAGGVLEDAMRKLCAKTSITLAAKPKLDTMNADLAKAGTYNLLTQKQVTAWADLRNKAAHGKSAEFTEEQVHQMVAGVRDFLVRHL